MRRLAGPLVKAAVLIAAAWAVWPHITSPDFVAAMVSTSPSTAVVVGVLFIFQAAIAAARWHWVLAHVGHRLSRASVLKAWLIGQLASQVLPAVIGGDAARIVFLRRYGVALSAAAASVFVDRFGGFVVLVSLSALSLPLLYVKVAGQAVPHELWSVIALGLLLCAALAVVLRWTLRSSVGDRLPAVGQVKTCLRRIPLGPRDLAFLAATGIGTYLTLILAAWRLGSELSVAIDLLACFAMLPTITLLTFAPISIAGWGVREILMVGALGLIGVPPAAALAVSVKLGIANLALGALGGAVWALSRNGTARDA